MSEIDLKALRHKATREWRLAKGEAIALLDRLDAAERALSWVSNNPNCRVPTQYRAAILTACNRAE